jgi:hypothetical protein
MTTAENTELQLEKGLSLIVGLTNSIGQVGSVWADAIVSMETAQGQHQAWLAIV